MARIAYQILALTLLLLSPGVVNSARCIPLFDCPQGYEAADYSRGSAGWHLVWFTQNPLTGKVYSDGFSCKHGTCDIGAFAKYLNDSRLNPDEFARASSARAKLSSLPRLDCASPDLKPLCDEREAFIASKKPEAEALFSLRPPLPTAPKFVVRKNSTFPTRPAYEYKDGVRGTVEKARAAVGVDCLPVLGEYGRYAPDYAANLIALCSPAGE